jgi:hypothetical protein
LAYSLHLHQRHHSDSQRKNTTPCTLIHLSDMSIAYLAPRFALASGTFQQRIWGWRTGHPLYFYSFM